MWNDQWNNFSTWKYLTGCQFLFSMPFLSFNFFITLWVKNFTLFTSVVGILLQNISISGGENQDYCKGKTENATLHFPSAVALRVKHC